MNSFLDQTSQQRGCSQAAQRTREFRHPRIEAIKDVDMFRYTAPLLVGLGSATLGLVSLRAESIATKVVAASGAVITGTLALGAVFAEVKGDN